MTVGPGIATMANLSEQVPDFGMVKKQQMQWSLRGAQRMLQVRAAVLKADLRERLAWQPPEPTHRYRLAWMFEPTPPIAESA